MKERDGRNYQDLDELLHSRIRLAVVSVLVSVEEIDFTGLRERVGATDGNLATHTRKLEDAGYIEVRKSFVDRKPSTAYRLTETGREKLRQYVAKLEQFLGPL